MRIPLLALALFALPVLAALPPRSNENLKSTATHVVTGKVRAVYSTVETGDRPDTADRKYVIELVVTAVEKGDGPAAGKVLYAKCWTIEKRPRGWAGGQGQNDVPKAGDAGRLFLTQEEDGSFTVLTPNGWAAEKP